MIKTVFLDIDDTLLDFHRAEALAIRTALTRFGIEPSEENVKRYSAINRSCWERFEKGEITRESVLTTRFEILFAEMGVEFSPDEAQRIYEYELGSYHFYIDGAENMLKEICDKYDLYITTNGISVVQNRRIADSGIAKYFKGIFISEEIGFNKPQKEYFDAIFEEINGFDKDKAIIVGDSLSSDIQGGINAQIKTCWYNPKDLPTKCGITPDYILSDITKLPNLLKQL